MKVEVECYAGRMADERPVRFRLEGRSYFVSDLLDQWYGPEHLFFKIRADDGGVYILRHETSVSDGEWELVSFMTGVLQQAEAEKSASSKPSPEGSPSST